MLIHSTIEYPELMIEKPLLNSDGLTPLDLAEQSGYPKVCEYFHSLVDKENSVKNN